MYFSNNIGFLLQENKLTQEEFADLIGRRKSIVGSYMKGYALPRVEVLMDISNYFGISVDELLYFDIKTKGNNNLTVKNDKEETKSNNNLTIINSKKNSNKSIENEKYNKSYQSSEEKQDSVDVSELRTSEANPIIQRVPLYDIEAVAGLVPLFSDSIKQAPIDYIQIPNLPKCDGAVYVTGDSMYPLLKSGDIVLYKKIRDINNCLFWGEMYLVSIDMDGEEYVTVKYIQKSDNAEYVRLVSHNQHHDDKDVLISNIRALAFIKASIRINSMK